jgi:regulator of ribonuclease activity A
MDFKTADLCDLHSDSIQICEPLFTSYGRVHKFSGRASTVKCFEDNTLVREALFEASEGGVLIVDAGGSKRCAMMGDMLAAAAIEHGWVGVIMFGLIRDSVDISGMSLGVKALGTHPLKSEKKGFGERDIRVHFSGVHFTPGDYVYADEDGILCSQKPLLEIHKNQ